MPDTATDRQTADGARRMRPTSLASHYAPGQDRPLASYAMLTATYGAGVTGALVALRARGRELPERFTTTDVLLIGISAHKLSRLVTKDKVTSFLRAPFTRFQQASGHGEVDEEPCGHGLRLAAGELLVCPYCLAQWVATGLTLGLVAAPRLTRLLNTIFVAHTVSDFLQVAYRAAEDNL
jgi:Protein of unknown function (DUF1360)